MKSWLTEEVGDCDQLEDGKHYNRKPSREPIEEFEEIVPALEAKDKTAEEHAETEDGDHQGLAIAELGEGVENTSRESLHKSKL